MNNPALENVKNLAFLSNESYKTAVDTVQKGKEKEQMSFNQPLKNPATNSSFEVFNQKNEITNINVIGEVELGFNNI